nr:hypothetical protein CFP56_14809 [Quercus suber]
MHTSSLIPFTQKINHPGVRRSLIRSRMRKMHQILRKKKGCWYERTVSKDLDLDFEAVNLPDLTVVSSSAILKEGSSTIASAIQEEFDVPKGMVIKKNKPLDLKAILQASRGDRPFGEDVTTKPTTPRPSS